jgi:ribosomal protein L11 methyltransferase
VIASDVAAALGTHDFTVSPAVGRDADSVWVLRPHPIHAGRLEIVPADLPSASHRVRLIDAPAFGTGLHPTTALCLELLNEILEHAAIGRVLDVGTGSGVLALAALALGVTKVTAIDVDAAALEAAAANARINAVEDRLELSCGGPDTVGGSWPLVLANVQAAPLIDIAPALVRRVGHHGRLVLSGIPTGVEGDVERTYRHLGMRHVDLRSRGGWIALVMQASW